MTYVLIPGRGGRAWYWHLVVAELSARRHEAIAVELPSDDDTKGLHDYAAAVLDAAGNRREIVLVATSLGSFVAPLVAHALQPRAIVLVNPALPIPGETVEAWHRDTGAEPARIAAAKRGGYSPEFDPQTYLMHDVPPDVLATVTPKGDQSRRPFRDPCTFDGWPAPVTLIAGRDDRVFPVEFQKELTRKRLGIEAVIIPGGHLLALSHPIELTDAILASASG
jgi:pimeloyl-ACP methyl ester carboxylesterase